MKKFLKYTALTLLTVVLLLVGGAYVAVECFDEEIKAELLAELNQNLQTEVAIKGDIKLAPWAYFPKVSLEVHQVEMQESTPSGYGPLLKAEKLYLLADIRDLFAQEWNAEDIVIEHGHFYMRRMEDGNINYAFAPPGTDTTAGEKPSTFFLNIARAKLKNIHYQYIDVPGRLTIDLQVKEASLSGNFSADSLFIEAVGELQANHLQMGDIDYLPGKAVSLNGNIRIDPQNNHYDIQTRELLIAGNRFIANGSVGIADEITLLDITAKGLELDIPAFLELLPEQYKAQMSEVSVLGQMAFEGQLKGELGQGSLPGINVDYEVENARVEHPDLPHAIEQLSFTGSYSNGEARSQESSSLSVRGLKMHCGESELAGDVVFSNFERPHLNTYLGGTLDLALLNAFMDDGSPVNNFSGKIDILKPFEFRGYVDDLRSKDIMQTLPLTTKIALHDVAFYYHNLPIQAPGGVLLIRESKVDMNTLQITTPHGSLTANGYLENTREYIMTLVYPKDGWMPPLRFDVDVHCNNVNISELMTYFEQDTATTQRSTNNVAQKSNALNLRGTLVLQATNTAYNHLAIDTLTIRLLFENGHIKAPQTHLSAFGGSLQLEGDAQQHDTHQWLVSAQCQGAHINLQQAFLQMDNFGQSMITHHNINGTLNGNAQFSLPFNRGQLQDNTMRLQATVEVNDGALIEFQPLYQLGRFIEMEELEHIKFATLENEITIADGELQIPEMLVQSSAISLSLAGTYSFDDIVDYNIKLNVVPLLANKIKILKIGNKHVDNGQFQPVDPDEYNGFATIKGPADDPAITFKLGRFQHQKQELKNAFKGKNGPYSPFKENKDWETDNALEEMEFFEPADTIPQAIQQ